MIAMLNIKKTRNILGIIKIHLKAIHQFKKLELVKLGAIDKRKVNVFMIAVMRNERLRLSYFVNYYRRLGVTHFLLVDNNSSDGCIDLVKSMPDVTIFKTDESYARAVQGYLWSIGVADRFCNNQWCVIADIDELLIYPECESIILSRLINVLESKGQLALRAFLLDLYSKGRIEKSIIKEGENPLNTLRYFSPIDPRELFERDYFSSSMRQKFFGIENQLIKYPFIKYSFFRIFIPGHHAIRFSATLSITGAVLHTKFAHDIIPRAVEESERKEHYMQAYHFRSIHETLKKNPYLSLYSKDSIEYKDSKQLVDLGYMKKIE